MKNAHHGLRRNRSFREAKHLTGTLRIARRKTRSLNPRQDSGCMLLAFSAILFLLPLARGQDETTPEGPAESAQEVTNFRLTDHRGLSHELYTRYDATAVVLIFDDNLSSQVEALVPEIGSLQAEFGTKGVVFWIINTADTVDRPALVSKAESLGLSLPMLHDWAGYVVDELGAKRISEAVIISAEHWTVVYQGLVAKGARRNLERPLAAALTELLRGDPITSAVVAADGPLIESTGTIDPNAPTDEPMSYAKDIAPLLIDRCIVCHSQGNIAPFAMTDYQVVRDWAPFIKEKVMARRMPPWYADREYGDFSNARGLTAQETATLLHWINDGASRQEDEDDPIVTLLADQPPAVSYPFAWPQALGEPDIVLTIPRQTIPPSGLVDYRYLAVPSGLKADQWLKAVVVLPGNPSVVHHCLNFVGSPLGDAFGLSGNFAGYVPGTQALAYPNGTGKFLPRGSIITFQIHYITTGQPEEDETQLGLYFMETPPEVELTTGAAFNFLFAIPPHDPDVEVMASKSFDQDTWLYELSPHMHYRGSRFRYEAHYPDGTWEILASVPKYWFDWQIPLRLTEPVFLPRGTRIECIGAFDNSAANRDNPNPNEWVFFGEQTEEEMFIGYMNFGVERNPPESSSRRR